MSSQYSDDTVNIDLETDDLQAFLSSPSVSYSEYLADVERTSTPFETNGGPKNQKNAFKEVNTAATVQRNGDDGGDDKDPLYDHNSSRCSTESVAKRKNRRFNKNFVKRRRFQNVSMESNKENTTGNFEDSTKSLNGSSFYHDELPRKPAKRRRNNSRKWADEKATNTTRRDMRNGMTNSFDRSFNRNNNNNRNFQQKVTSAPNAMNESEKERQHVFELRRILFPCINHFLHCCRRGNQCQFSHRFTDNVELKEALKMANVSDIWQTLRAYNQFFRVFTEKLSHFMRTSYVAEPTLDTRYWMNFSMQLSAKIKEMTPLLTLHQPR